MSKAFPIGAVLSVTTGRLVSENHIEGVYDILNYMTGENLFTHQLPRACEAASPVILNIYPELKSAQAEAEQVNAENIFDWLKIWKERFGDELEVPVLSAGQYERKGMLTELTEMVSPEKIVVVKT